jgi:hypothetical protein
MMYQVLSKRLAWPAGSIVSAADLAGGNIEMLVATGHLTPAPTPKKKSKWEPEQPVTDDDAAEQPEEQ